LCDRIAIIDGGRIIASGPPRDLIAASSSAQNVLLRTATPIDRDWLAQIPGIDDLTCDNAMITFRTTTPGAALAALMQIVHERGVEVVELHARKARLEDVFLALTSDQPPQ
jgi:ABC-2 type transport system ATP-binding protein